MQAEPQAAAAAEHAISGARSLARYTRWLLGTYVVGMLVVSIATKTTPSADVFFVFAALAAILAGRAVPFVRDWGPFLLIFLAWEAMRGVANQFGQAVQSDSVIALERTLMLGIVPTVELQAALRTAGELNALDVGLSLVYMSHFFFPLALAFAFWWTDRARYYRFAITLMLVSFAAFFTFLLLPVAPPRFASLYGQALPVVDVMHEVTRAIEWNGFSWMYRNLVGNPVAAFPSMHAAYPVIVWLFLREVRPRAAWAWMPAIGLIWFATVYLGHHYVVDLVGGAVYAVAGYAAVRTRTAAWLGRRYGSAFRRLRRDGTALGRRLVLARR